VAYRQPICRADIEAIRGVQVGEILRHLLEEGLVRLVGKDESLGRPFLYGTTPKFLQWFGLRHLNELPMVESLAKPAGKIAQPIEPPDGLDADGPMEADQAAEALLPNNDDPA
jgi:segregation and condensation protein B